MYFTKQQYDSIVPEKSGIKADMDSDILLQTAAIFFLTNLYLKQGIG